MDGSGSIFSSRRRVTKDKYSFRSPLRSPGGFSNGRSTPNSRASDERSLRSMLPLGQNLTSVTNSPHTYDTQFKPPPLPTPPPELAYETLETSKEAMRRYKKLMGPYAQSYHASNVRSKTLGLHKKAEQQQQAERELFQCLKTVPDVYFRADFDIKDKDFFSQLSERKDKMVLQDKLSYYLDLVEVNLLKQICLRSSSVFAALQTIQKLHTDVAAACRQIKSIRQNIQRLHTHLVASVANVLRAKRRNVNVRVLKEKIELISTVVCAHSTVQVLLSTADFANALSLITQTKRILQSDLEGVACVANISHKLDQQAILIEKLVTTDFTHLALCQNNLKEVASEDLKGFETKIDKETSRQMSQLAANALKMGKMTQMVSSLGTAVNKFVRQAIKDFLNYTLDKMDNEDMQKEQNNVTDEKGSGSKEWKTRVKELEHGKFLRLLALFFPLMIRILQRLANIEQTLQDVPKIISRQEAESLGEEKGDVKMSEDLEQAMGKYQKILSSTGEFIHGRASQLLLTRKANFKFLNLTELRGVFDVTDRFITQSGKLCKQKFWGLLGTLKDLTKRFLEAFHSKNLTHLNASLEAELWKQADVPGEFQDLIDSGFKRKMQSLMRREGDRKISRVIFFAVPVHEQNGAQSGFLKFALVSSTLILLKMISRYIECASQLKVVGSDILNKLVQLLQLFNSKSCGLVLGAAAIQTAGLSKINVSHLALVSQSLGLVISQIPVVRSALKSHLPSKHFVLLDNFNNVKEDYKQHQREIFNKLVQIIEGLVDPTLRNLVDSPWAQPNDQSRIKVDSTVKKLMKMTASMHNKLSSLLDQTQRDHIFNDIAKVYSRITKKHFQQLFVSGNATIKKKISTQVHHILSRLRSLAGLGRNACQDLEFFTAA